MMKDKEMQLLKHRAKELARKRSAPEAGQASDLLVVEFFLSPDHYMIEAKYVREIFKLQSIAKLPGTPDFVLGLVNHRGHIVSVNNLRLLMGAAIKGLMGSDHVILLQDKKMEFGVLADKVLGANHVSLEKILPPPASTGHTIDGLVKGVTLDGVLFLDGEKLLHNTKVLIDQK